MSKRRLAISTLTIFAIAIVLSVSVTYAQSSAYFLNDGPPSSCTYWHNCVISNSNGGANTLTTGILYESSSSSISSWTISGSTTTDPYSRYLSVYCYNGPANKVYTLEHNAVVSGSFSYSFTSSSYPGCVYSYSGGYQMVLEFNLTTYTGSWSINEIGYW
jgi:hypothetical protein